MTSILVNAEGGKNKQTNKKRVVPSDGTSASAVTAGQTLSIMSLKCLPPELRRYDSLVLALFSSAGVSPTCFQ